ncbi:hypothetical protein D3C80_2154720 [compost metagenome]
MQDRLGHRQANQRLLDYRRGALMGQSDQLRLKRQPFTTQDQAIVVMIEQRTVQLRFKLRQVFA